MRILFAVTHLGFLRNFESTLGLLAERGHDVRLVVDRQPQPGVIDGRPIVERLQARFPQAFAVETVPVSKRGAGYGISAAVRGSLNYWRYLSPAFERSPKLRARARAQAPAAVVRLTDLPLLRSRVVIGALGAAFRAVERAIPVRGEIEALFDRWSPDVLLVTPLLYFGSQQVDYVRCARVRGIRSVLGVGSWDHLTTKGVIHELPDRILVWNELQRAEAVELHGARPEQVVVTGAQAYDHWFAACPSTSRDQFCARVGLSSARPYLLYLCSSPFIAPYEVGVVRRWIEAIRRSGRETLRTAGILVRPHPQNAAQWSDADCSTLGDVAIWPRAGANPIGPDARGEYYDSMYHSHAVVGVNTSALIESGIVGRLVFSFHAREFADTQEGTLHFRHLRRGLLQLADGLEEHVAQLERSFESPERDRDRVREFIREFVRPYGLDRPATPLVVEAIEALAAV
ncbi:MAG: hypothetical protein HY657_06430 [Acidobacteria bacterium]|nr:hypothetical protein [Acidobacteriota bacterium]